MNEEYPELTQITILENQLKLCKNGREFSHANNVILNKNLVLKFGEVDELVAAIKKYHRSLLATNACTDMLLSSRTSDEPARLMQAMYKSQSEMFLLAGVNYFGGNLGSE